MHEIPETSRKFLPKPSAAVDFIDTEVYQASPNFHQGPALTTPARMWNMFACLKKEKKVFFILPGFRFHVSVSWTSWQPLNILTNHLQWGREEFPGILIVLVHSLHLYVALERACTCTLHWQMWKLWQCNSCIRGAVVPVLMFPAAYCHQRNLEICYAADSAVFGCVVWNHWRVMKTSYFWAHAMGREHYKALCISLNRVLSNANRTNKMQTWLKDTFLQWKNHAYCTPHFLLHGCRVLFHPVLLHAIFLVVLKVRSFQLYERMSVCVCVWGPEMKPTATASSDLMQKAAGSSTIHYSLLCASSLQWLWSLLSLSTLSRLAENRDGGWGVVGVQECHLHRWTVAGYAVEKRNRP